MSCARKLSKNVFADAPGGSQVPETVIEAMASYLRTSNANAHGAFATSAETDRLIEEAHRAGADLLGCHPSEVVFGPNATTLLFALSRSMARTLRPGDEVVVTTLDHDANIRPWVMAAEDSGARLLVAGHGPDEATLLPRIESSPAARFLGNVPYEEVLDWTAMADAVVALYDPAIPGNRLASPNKLFEAMMFGKPVIVSDGTRMAEIVRTQGCGLIVTYGDRKALQSALERLMLSPEDTAVMGARGRAAYAANYTWAAMSNRLVKAYAEL